MAETPELAPGVRRGHSRQAADGGNAKPGT